MVSMFKPQANFPASLKLKKKQAKINFLNKYGATERHYLKPLTAKEHCVNFSTSTQWEFFDQLSKLKC